MSSISILTDFREAAEKLEEYVTGKNFKRKDTVEPTLYSVNAGDVDDVVILEVLTNGFHVEKAGEDRRDIVFISDDREGLQALVNALQLQKEIRIDGGNEIVEMTGPILETTEEI